MLNLYKNFIKSGVGVILTAVFGLLLLRFISHEMGVIGIAKFGIYRQFIQFCTVFISWGNGFSIIESFSKAKDKQHFTSNTFKYFQFVTFALSIPLILFAKPISSLLFNESESSDLILYSPLVFLTLSNYSFFRFIITAKRHLLSAGLLQALPFAFMLFFFFIFKDYSRLFITSYLLSAIVGYFAWRRLSSEDLRIFSTFERLTEFEKTSLATIITGSVGFLSPLIVKSLSAHYLGLELTGVLEAEFSLISYLTLAMISGLGTFYLGQVSERPTDIHFREKTYLFLVPMTALALTTLIIFQSFFVGLLFGTEILQYRPNLSIFAIGELFRCANWFFIFSMIGLSHRRKYIKLDVISNIMYIITSLILVSSTRSIESLRLSYLIFQLIYLILNLRFCLKAKIISAKIAFTCLVISLAVLVPVSLGKVFNG